MNATNQVFQDDPHQGVVDLIDDLLRWTDQRFVDLQAAPGSLDVFALLTAAEMLRTTKACVVLLNAGFAQEALKLTRALFESTIVLAWMVYGPMDDREIVERLNDHQAYLAYLGDRDDADGPFLTVPAVDRMRAQFGKYGENSWWQTDVASDEYGRYKVVRKRRLDHLAGETVNALEDRQDVDLTKLAAAIARVFDISRRLLNGTLHHSPMSIASTANVRYEPPTFNFDLDASPDSRGDAARSTFLCAFSIATVLCDRCNPGIRDELQEFEQRDPFIRSLLAS